MTFSWPSWLKGKPKPLLQETAPVQGVSLIGALSPLAFSADTIPGGEGYLTYRKMQHDPQVKACLSTKKVAVLSRGWDVHPAGPGADDAACAQFAHDCLTEMRGSVLDALHDALDALALGVSILELNWRPRPDGKIGLDSIKAKDPALFLLDTDPFLNVTGLRTMLAGTTPTPASPPLPHQNGGGASGEGLFRLPSPAQRGRVAEGRLGASDSLPLDKFILYPYQPSYANPLGASDLRAAWQPWFLKQQMQRWWAKSLEKFGMPTVTGSYDAKAGYGVKQQREFLRLLSAVHNESAIIHPADMEVGLLEAGRLNTGEGGFAEAVAYCDRSIAKSILGQSLTSDSSDRGSTYALGQVQENVLSFYLQKLQRDLEETVMNEQVIKRLMAYNFPPGTPCPTFHLGRVDDDRLAQTAQLMTALISGGVVAPDEPWIRGYLGLPSA